jgi:hypothetical protein
MIDRVANQVHLTMRLLNREAGLESERMMEIILNLAWACCSIGLIVLWLRMRNSDPSTRRMQLMALAMVVLLLLPVISLSDDLLAMQAPAETDSGARRVTVPSEYPSVAAQPLMSLPEEALAGVLSSGLAQVSLKREHHAPPQTVLIRSLDRRPPPQV